MKIVYCLDSISRIGGIEKITVLKANAIAETEGWEVFIVVCDHVEGCGFADMLSAKVRLVNLGVGYGDIDWRTRLHGILGLLGKKRRHKRLLRRVLREIEPDIVISTGLLEKFMLPSVAGGSITVREFHFSRSHRRLAYRNSSLFDRIIERFADWYEYGYLLRRYNHIVVLTNEDKESNWKHWPDEKMSVIPNFITTDGNVRPIASRDGRKFIAAGRLVPQKNFSSLIRAFRAVAYRQPEVVLEIYGDGAQYDMLQNFINDLHLGNNVYLKGATMHLPEKMAEASCFVLTSLYEGFPIVIAEAMSCGLPVVSYDCPCGPKDLITEGADGFLVPVGDEQALAEKICHIIENRDARIEMGRCALKKSESYRPERIVPMWTSLFGRLLEAKRQRLER